MTSSGDLPPATESYFRLFVRSQFMTELRAPPKGLNLTGQTGIITGSNVGLGLECARILLNHQLSHIILAVRSRDKGQAAAAELQRAHPAAKIDVWLLDMLSYDSVRAFAQKCTTLARIDFVILNAGLGLLKFQQSESTGHEEMFQVNYLSTVLLAILLLPVLKQKRPNGIPGRLSIVSSGLVLCAKFPEQTADPLIPAFSDEPGWSLGVAVERYRTSKLLAMMAFSKLKDTVDPDDVVVNLVDPGFTRGTSLARNAGYLKPIGDAMKVVTSRSLQGGAWTYVDAVAVKGKESHGCFLYNWEIFPFATMMYSPEGKQVTERLWTETLDELDFARVKDILASMSKGLSS